MVRAGVGRIWFAEDFRARARARTDTPWFFVGTRRAIGARVRRWLWLGAPLASLCVLLLVGMESLSRTTRAVARLSSADEIRLALDDLVTTLDEAESGERAYLMTRDRTFLEPYDRAMAQRHDAIASLRALSDSTQRDEIAELERLVDSVLGSMRRALADSSSGAVWLAEEFRRASSDIASIRRVGNRIQDHADAIARSRVATAMNRARWAEIAFVGVLLSFAFGGVWVSMQRQQAERRAKLVDVTDQFVAVLGHDLRNPLGASLMAAKLLAARDLAPAESMLVQRILNSTQRMLRMIDDLLDLARTRLGPGIPVARTPCDLRDIVANVIDELRTRYPDRRISWDWRGDGFGQWDHDRMAQLVSNLVGNAIEHGDPAQPVEARLERMGRTVELSVHNFGEPIPPEALPTLFESYKRGSSTTKGRGLGLGLYIAEEIARAHHGTLRVSSTTKDGTRFRATFEGAR